MIKKFLNIIATLVLISTFLICSAHAQTPPPHYAASQSTTHLGYGAGISSPDHAVYLPPMGFDWAKGYVYWDRVDLGGGSYHWGDVDNQMREFTTYVDKILLVIEGPPPSGVGNPPTGAGDLARFQTFVTDLARHNRENWGAGYTHIAYEIWNEPNLDIEWGWQEPNPPAYAAVLQAGYNGVKAGDGNATVVSAGLAPVGAGLYGLMRARLMYKANAVMNDLDFMRGMYDAGAQPYFDALGAHPYGGPYAPETAASDIYFRRAESARAIMEDYNDTAKTLWLTEFGWIIARPAECGTDGYTWMEVSEEQQAQYLADAYRYAAEHWAWVGPMFMFNLDFATVTWYPVCEQMRWFSILYRENPQDPGNSPILERRAVRALTELEKYPAAAPTATPTTTQTPSTATPTATASQTPPTATPTATATSLPASMWDPELDTLNVYLVSHTPAQGETYWKLVSAEYLDAEESDGRHHIYYAVQDESGVPLLGQTVCHGWPDGQFCTETTASGGLDGQPGANIGLYAGYDPYLGEVGPYFAWVDDLSGDAVHGLGLPLNHHVSFVLTWQRATASYPVPILSALGLLTLITALAWALTRRRQHT